MDYIYANLPQSVTDINYEGKNSKTAEVIVNNDNRTIAVNVRELSPDQLLVEKPTLDGTYVLRAKVFNGLITYEWVSDEFYLNNSPTASGSTVVGGHMICGTVGKGDDTCQ